MRFAPWIVCGFLVGCGKGADESGSVAKKAAIADACEATEGCKITGACSNQSTSTTTVEEFGSKGDVHVERTRSGGCGPSKPEHCKSSQFCKERGWCSLGKAIGGSGTECVIGTDADCRASDSCRELGQCARLTDRICIATSDADCAAAAECAARGHCVFKRKDKDGVALCGPKAAADCKAAPYCAKKGYCNLVQSRGLDQCGAKSDADCQASEECKTKGLCRWWVGAVFCATVN